MITNVTHVSVLVEDQDKALEFYTQKLGFEVHTDAMFGQMRWLTVNPQGNKNFEIALMATQPEFKDIIGKQAGSYPLCAFATDDCRKTYATLKERGVEFIDEPKDEPWGTGCSFKDLNGNVFYLCQTSDK